MRFPNPDMSKIRDKSRIVKLFHSILPENAVIYDPMETRAYECDAFTAYTCPPMIVVMPQSTEEVAKILSICSIEGLKVVPRGAGTSLAGGALPTSDSIVISTMRLNKILNIDYENGLVHVQTGLTNISISQEVDNKGFFYAPDPSSQLACTIAGNIAMNSGGAHCLKYGVTTNNLLGAKIVLMNGTIIDVGGEMLDPGGLDILGVFCGSEGQLGIVTEAILKIIPKPESAKPVLIGFDSSEIAGICVADIIEAGILPVAIEFMDRPCIRACEAFVNAGYPDVEALLIIEVEGSQDEINHQLSLINTIAGKFNWQYYKESQSEDESKKLWSGRKAAFGAMGRISDYICLDGTIPVSELPKTLRGIKELATEFGLEVANVFHAGDGNLHPLILFNANKEGDLAMAEKLGSRILELCVEAGGCLTGEHGVGVEKRDLMYKQFSIEDMEAQMIVKDVFDPQWLLNPDKVFPLELSRERRCG